MSEQALFTVDENTCKRCGICGMACPIVLMYKPDKEAVPVPVKGAEEACIRCGHCVAVCPTGAMRHSEIPIEDCPPIQKDLLLSPQQVEHWFRSRRSIRNYKAEQVDRAVLEQLINMARYAPTGHNRQNVRWLVVNDAARVKEFGGLVVDWMRYLLDKQPEFARSMHMDMVVAGWEIGFDSVMRGAPCLVVAHAPKADQMAPTSCTIALAYLELAAPSLKLGACWAGFFQAAIRNWPPLAEALDLPEGHVSNGGMLVGYPKLSYKRLTKRDEPSIIWR
ncbi:MAG: nitroreductase family protein [Desulfatibacillaceae bacterium]